MEEYWIVDRWGVKLVLNTDVLCEAWVNRLWQFWQKLNLKNSNDRSSWDWSGLKSLCYLYPESQNPCESLAMQLYVFIWTNDVSLILVPLNKECGVTSQIKERNTIKTNGKSSLIMTQPLGWSCEDVWAGWTSVRPDVQIPFTLNQKFPLV